MKTEAVTNDQSRVLGVVQQLVERPLDAEEAYSRLVILTGDAATLATDNGKWCLVDALHLLCRTIGNLHVQLPLGLDPQFEQHVRGLTSRLWSRRTISISSEPEAANWKNAKAVLCIGAEPWSELPWTAINSNGWVARVSSLSTALPTDCGQPNPIAAMLAAAFGVVEVFKRVFDVPTDSGALLDASEFSLFDYSCSPADIGPCLPVHIALPDTAMFGAGAIGNAVALLLSHLPVTGRVHMVDKQAYAHENAETCTQIEREGWVKLAKAERLAEWLRNNSKLQVTGEQAFAADAISNSKDLSRMAVDLVLSGFDDVQARHDVQRLWPSTLVDGGISQVSAGVTQYRVEREGFACMRCSFRLPQTDIRELHVKLVGLRLEHDDTDRLVTDADIEAALPEYKDMLKQAQEAGKRLCSVIADANRVLGTNLAEGFQPSAPFVAAASAALMLAEVIKALAFPDARAAQQFQFGNLFLGPESSVSTAAPASDSCQCVLHRHHHMKHANRRASQRASEH